MVAVLKFSDELKKEVQVSEFVPYSSHVTENIIKCHTGDYVSVIKVQGVAYESADIVDINGWHNQFTGLLRNLASPNVAVHTHIVRRESDKYPGGEFENKFCREFNDKYRNYVTSEKMYVNELYLSIIYRQRPEIIDKALAAIEMQSLSERKQLHKECIGAMGDAVSSALTILSNFDVEQLGCYEHNGTLFSEILEFFGFLANGVWEKTPFPRCDIRAMLPSARAFFGKSGTGMLKCPAKDVYFSQLSFQEYPHPTYPGILDGLLKVHCEYVVSQSYTFTQKHLALGMMKLHKNRLISTGDASTTQINEIDDAMDGLTSNEFVIGYHSLSITVKAGSQKDLNNNVNMIGGELSDVGAKWVREDLAMQGAFYSQLPGNFKFRTNITPITSKNFCGLSAFHNFPSGRISGSQWGDAVTMFRTSSGAPYFFNFHAGQVGVDAKKAGKLDPNYFEAANTLIIGKPGTGKTVLFGILLAQLQKFRSSGKKMTCVVFDRDMGSSIFIRAAGGLVYPLKIGVRSGFNPFQLPNTPDNIEFLNSLVKQLVRHEGYPLTPTDEKAISDAINGVMCVGKENRRVNSVKEFLLGVDSSDHSIGRRLAKWCNGGANSWLFDNVEDTLEIDCPIVGFDVTEFLESDVKTPTMMYLMHRVKGLMDGRRLPIFMGEFGILLSGDDEDGNSVFADYAEKGITQLRKKNAFMVLEAQDLRQAMGNKATYALINQTDTKIFLPNSTANREDYTKTARLTNQEFEIIRSLGEKSRCVLIKQGLKSVVAQINLKGFEDELAILSGNVITSALCEQVVGELGNDPDTWIPEFHKRRLQ